MLYALTGSGSLYWNKYSPYLKFKFLDHFEEKTICATRKASELSLEILNANIDNLIDATELIEKLQDRQDGDSGMFGTFFGDSKP